MMARKTLAELVKKASRRPVSDKPVKQQPAVLTKTEAEKQKSLRRRREMFFQEIRLRP